MGTGVCPVCKLVSDSALEAPCCVHTFRDVCSTLCTRARVGGWKREVKSGSCYVSVDSGSPAQTDEAGLCFSAPGAWAWFWDALSPRSREPRWASLAVPFPACEPGGPAGCVPDSERAFGSRPPVDTPLARSLKPLWRGPRHPDGRMRWPPVGTKQCRGRAEGEPLRVLGDVRDRLEQLRLASGGQGDCRGSGHPGDTVDGNHTPFPQTWLPGVGAGPRVWSQETQVHEGLHPSGDLGATLHKSLPLRWPSVSSDPSSGHVPRPADTHAAYFLEQAVSTRPAGVCVCVCDTETIARELHGDGLLSRSSLKALLP